MTLVERILAVHRALTGSGVAHAFGGALALAYATREPRGTVDIDVNVFVAPDAAASVFASLPDGVAWSEGDVVRAHDDAQVRLWWDDTPVDLFFDAAAFHREVAGRVRQVELASTTIPVLHPDDLAVFKALFDRTKDWADLEAMVAAGALDLGAVRDRVEAVVGRDDHRIARLSELGGAARG